MSYFSVCEHTDAHRLLKSQDPFLETGGLLTFTNLVLFENYLTVNLTVIDVEQKDENDVVTCVFTRQHQSFQQVPQKEMFMFN